MDLKDKKVALLGFGVENQALLPYLHGLGAKITICDRNEQLNGLPAGEHRLGPEYLEHLTDFEIVFRTPGIPYLTRQIQEARQAGVLVTSQTKLFLAECPAAVIGVTGTKGKGTTASLIMSILLLAQKRGELPGQVYLAGNIGEPPISLLPVLTDQDWVILELSSFQLQDINQSPDIAVVLNISPDHLDHHRDEAEYIAAKKNIVLFQTPGDYLVVNLDSLTSLLLAEATPAQTYFFSRQQSVDQGAFVAKQLGDDRVILRLPDHDDQTICPVKAIKLIGSYNLENVTAAITVSALAGASTDSIRQGVTGFTGLPHRLQFVAQVNGVGYYDDSKATMPDATIAAIQNFEVPITLIVGGSPKGADFSQLVKTIMASSVRSLIVMGPEGQKIKQLLTTAGAWQSIIEAGPTMPDIVSQAADQTKPGGVVLLSPGAASFDMFINADDRGQQFQAAVKEGLGDLKQSSDS